MNFVSKGLFKVDIEDGSVTTVDPAQFGADLNDYLVDLASIIINHPGGRQFQFQRSTLEIPVVISKILEGGDFDALAKTIAERLLDAETKAQAAVAKLNVQIQKGLLIIARLEVDGKELIMFCKADDTEYLNEVDFTRARGLPIEKKIFKAFHCKIGATHQVESVKVLDTFPTMSKYWWSDFLELTEIYNDTYNTKSAFQAIDVGVFNKIKEKHPQDYVHLRNSTVRYFRAEPAFEMENFIANAIGAYSPLDDKLDVDGLKTQIRNLPTKRKFDPQFNIIKSEITARFKSNIALTPQIDLVIKEDIDLEGTISAEQDIDGSKYVKIRSEAGYNYFKDKIKDNDQE